MSDAGAAQPDAAPASDGRRESEGDIHALGDEELRRRIESLEMSTSMPPTSDESADVAVQRGSTAGSTARGDSPTLDSSTFDYTTRSTATNSTRGFDSTNLGSSQGLRSTQGAPEPPGDVVLNGPHAVLAPLPSQQPEPAYPSKPLRAEPVGLRLGALMLDPSWSRSSR